MINFVVSRCRPIINKILSNTNCQQLRDEHGFSLKSIKDRSRINEKGETVKYGLSIDLPLILFASEYTKSAGNTPNH